MKAYFQNHQKTIFLLFCIILLSIVFVFSYNKEKEISADEQLIWDCGEEIPIGEAVDEAIALVNTVTSNADQMLVRGGQQVAAAYRTSEIDLPGECKADNCNTGCTESVTDTDFNDCAICPPVITHHTAPRAINPTCPAPPGIPCSLMPPVLCVPPLYMGCNWEWDETSCECTIPVTNCTIDVCSGSPCPADLIIEAVNNVGLISELHPLIIDNAAAINAAIAMRPGIIDKLNDAREELAECATPASGYEAEEIEDLVQVLISCPEAKYLRILSEDQEDCYKGTYSPNFFCCKPTQR